jgi:tetratricopeptide (TPR) repeat protein
MSKYLEYIIIGVIILTFIIFVRMRNEIWSSEISLWQDCLMKSPNKVRPYINLGAAYILDKKFENGKQVLLMALKMDDKDYTIYYNLAIACYSLKDLQHAYAPARKAVLLHKDTMTLYQLGVILRDMGWKAGMENPREYGYE